MDWYVSKEGNNEGPYSDDEIRALVAEGEIRASDLVWSLRVAAWTPAERVAGLLGPSEGRRQDGPNAHKPVLSRVQGPVLSRVEGPLERHERRTAETIQRDPQLTSSSYHSHYPAHGQHLKSYFNRHWHGDLSLPVSYWINGSLPALILALLIVAVPWDDFVSDSPRAFSIAALGIRLLAVLITVWQVVGIWRSANNYLRQRKPRRWGRLARIAVVLGIMNFLVELAFIGVPQINEFARIAAGNDPLGRYQLRLLRNGTELEISGSIVFGLTNDTIAKLDAHPAIRVIHLNSPGGRVAEARKLRDAIGSRKLATYTASSCFSACTLAYLAGQPRLISRHASLGFHQYSFPGAKQIAFQREYDKDKRDWSTRGIQQSFIDRAFTTPSTDLWKPSHRELFSAGVVTGYVASSDAAMSAVPLAELASVDEVISKDPLFAALKQYDPDAYKKVAAELAAGFVAGRSPAELRAKILPVAQAVYRRRLPHASGSTLISFTDLMLEQINVLYVKDPALCYRYLFPDSDVPTLDPAMYFSKELLQRESSIMAEVVRTAAIQNNPPPQSAQIEPQLKNVMTALSERHGDDARMLGDPRLGKSDKAKMCALTYDLYQTIRRLPEQQSASLLRFMFANAR